jgi:hypothetical protein
VNKVQNIIKEEILSLFEVGEATASTYKWEITKYGNYGYKYEFTTEDNDIYHLEIDQNVDDKSLWDIQFGVENYSFEDVVNKGKLYKVMATIVAAVKDFAKKENPDKIIILPAKNNQEDTRRHDLYMAFIRKNLPDNYIVDDKYIDKRFRIQPQILLRKVKQTQPTTINETTYKVYHGTNQPFDKFDFKHATQGIVWFTDSIDSIKNQTHGGAGNRYIMTRYITINKPAGWVEYDKYGLQQLEDMGYDGVILPQSDKTDYFVFSNKSIRKTMPKDIVGEELENFFPLAPTISIVNEVGEANLQPYPYTSEFNKFSRNIYGYIYNFTTEDNDRYIVHIVEQGTYTNIDFKVLGYNTDDIGMYGYGAIINKGRIFQIFATLAKIIKEYVKERNPKEIKIEAIKSKGEDDTRRLNIYMAFIKKNLPLEYNVRYQNPYIIISRKQSLTEEEQEDYKGYHQAPGKDDSPMYDVTNAFSEDIYGNDAVRLFGVNEPYDRYSIAIIQQARNKPNQQIKIYRAIPKVITNQEKINDYQKRMKYILKTGKLPRDITNWRNSSEYYDWLSNEVEKLKTVPANNENVKINNGDWVTINPAYAKEHGANQLSKYRVLSKTVSARQLFTDGNSIHEWGYNIV